MFAVRWVLLLVTAGCAGWLNGSVKRTSAGADAASYRAAMKAAQALGIAQWLTDRLPAPQPLPPRPDLAYPDSASNTDFPCR